VIRGDLLQEPVEAIVNAANGRLGHGGGVAGVIARAAGPALQQESDLYPRHGESDEEARLFSALSAAWACARERGWQSVSFPAVSSGIFAVPLDICARAYLKAARRSPLSNVRLCLRDQPAIDAVLEEMKR
jgi:O-acetyl-ADP-ribose deacetylase (regulator of RNase III)